MSKLLTELAALCAQVEADTIEEVARVYEEQFRTKGRLWKGTS